VRRKMPKVKMVCGDTMNYWIKDHAENLARVLKGLDVLLIKRHRSPDAREGQQSGAGCLVKSSTWVRRRWSSSMASTARRPSSVSARLQGKKDPSRSHSARLLCPLAEVVDPRAPAIPSPAGSSATLPRSPRSPPPSFRRAMFYGSVMGSFAVERFGTERLQQLDPKGNRGTLCALPPALATSSKPPRLRGSKKAGEGADSAARERRSLRSRDHLAGMVAALFSVLGFRLLFPANMLLLYGEQSRTLGIARRLIDSLNPAFARSVPSGCPFRTCLIDALRGAISCGRTASPAPFVDGLLILGVAGLWRLSRYWLRPRAPWSPTLFLRAQSWSDLLLQTTP